MSVTLLTVYSENWRPLVDVTLPIWRAYAHKHEYLLIANRKPDKPDKYFGWLRLEDLYDYLFVYNLAETFFLFDCDSVVTNPEIKIESLLDDEHDFYITKDANGFNASQMIFRQSAWTKRLLREWSKQDCDGDQDAFALIYPQFADRTKVLPQSAMNSYFYGIYTEKSNSGEWHPEDFVLHIPAKSLTERVTLFGATEHFQQMRESIRNKQQAYRERNGGMSPI